MDKRERNRIKRSRLKKGRRRAGVEVGSGPVGMRASDTVELQALARDLIDEGRLVAACEALALAASLQPASKEVAGRYLHAAELSGDVSHTITALEHILGLVPGSPATLAHLAELHRRAGNGGRAAEIERYLLARLRDEAGDVAGGAGRRRREASPGRAPRAASAAPRRRRSAAQQALLFDAPQRDAEPGPEASPARAPASDGSSRGRGVPRAGDAGRPSGVKETTSSLGAEGRAARQRASRPIARATSAAPVARPGSGPGGAPAAAAAARAPEPSAPDATPPESTHPPGALEIPVVVTREIAGLEALSLELRDGPGDVELALLAAQLRDAESFDRLLALERATGLIHLSHQEETARKVMSAMLGRALLADEVGLGKTIEAGLVLAEYVQRGRVKRALVLVPASLVGQWREEMASKFGVEALTSEDEVARRDPEALWEHDGVVVASLATARSERNRARVASRPWDMVIVDEAHCLKNHRTESYALVERLKSRFLLLLTATPVESRLEELFNLVSLIRPGHLGGRAEFVRRYGDAGGKQGERAGAELRRLLGELMVRNTRALSGVDLPPRFARTELVAPGADEERLYAELSSALRALDSAGRARQLLSLLLQEAGSSPHAVRDTLAKVCRDETLPPQVRRVLAGCGEAAQRATGSEKARALLTALAGGDGPAIVFTRFRGTLAFLSGVLERAGVRHRRLDGETPARLRAEAIESCRATGGVLLSTDVGSEGLNLQFCRRIVNFDLPWNPMRLEQRIGRLHRIGQEHPVEVLNLCLAGSIEERILEILDRRINLFELVIGEIETILGYLEGDFADLVLDAHGQGEASERERAFASIGEALAAARQRYRAVKSFDESLFRSELGV